MSMTLDEIVDRLLTEYDTDDILTLLDIQADELVWMFEHKIDERREQILEALDEPTE